MTNLLKLAKKLYPEEEWKLSADDIPFTEHKFKDDHFGLSENCISIKFDPLGNNGQMLKVIEFIALNGKWEYEAFISECALALQKALANQDNQAIINIALEIVSDE